MYFSFGPLVTVILYGLIVDFTIEVGEFCEININDFLLFKLKGNLPIHFTSKKSQVTLYD